MLEQIFLFAVAASCLVAFVNWRLGCYLLIAVAAFQDPIRKLIPGTPGYLVLATAPIWGTIVISSFSKIQGLWHHFNKHHRTLSLYIVIFLISIVPGAFKSATYGHNSWMITIIGLFSYGSIICGWLIGYAYSKRPEDIHKILAFYCIVTALMLIGTPLEYLGILKWSVLGTEVMAGHEWLRYGLGYTVKLISGFYRSPDVMGWHASMTAMLAIILALKNISSSKRYFWLFIASWGIAAILLCGRRKMVLMIPVFCMTLIWLYWWSRSHNRMSAVLGIILAGTVMGYIAYDQMGRSPEAEKYYISTIGDAPLRVKTHGYDALITTYRQSGFFGEGVGTATQGTQHLTAKRPRTWQEGGLSKLLVELGVLGLICFSMLAITLVWRVTWLISRRLEPKSREFPIMVGLTAILFANACSFVVSHQVFGDPFIVVFFSILVGFILSIGKKGTIDSQKRGLRSEVGGLKSEV